MRADFTLDVFIRLLTTLQCQGFSFQSFENFFKLPEKKVIILRHDVDRLPTNALTMARREHAMGVAATYYFRTVRDNWDIQIARAIFGLGHEIGYHYENMETCNGDLQSAIKNFQTNLTKIRLVYPVKTICMHGSPLSKWDNRDLWKTYDYRDYGIIAEPYFDVDFKEVLYLTDTGRRWDGDRVSVRDKVSSTSALCAQYRFKHTHDIIDAAEKGLLPDKIMLNVHPQRWTNNPVSWMRELILQNMKNVVKMFYVK